MCPLTHLCVPTYEALYDQGGHHLSLSLREVLTDPQQHQHIVALAHTTGVEVTQHIGTRYLALHATHTCKHTDGNRMGIGLEEGTT